MHAAAKALILMLYNLRNIFFLFSIYFSYSNVPCVPYSRNKSLIKCVYLHGKTFKAIKRNSGIFVTNCWSTHINCSSNCSGNATEILVPQKMLEISPLFFKITRARQKFPLFLGWSPSKGSLCEPFG